MPPLQGSDVAFSRHDNSFQAFRDDSMVHKKFTACRPALAATVEKLVQITDAIS